MLEKLQSFTKKVADLPDQPSLSPNELKAQFDAAPEELRQKFNTLIDALMKTTSGDSGAKYIGATAISGLTGSDVQTLMESIYNKLASAGIEVMSTNANGSYIRYTNGTQICWYSANVTDQAINGAYGSLFIGSRNWTYPKEFLAGSVPTVTCSQFKWGTGSSWGTNLDATDTVVTLSGIDVSSRAVGTSCKISAFAIGKWK
jgi:hypothetical protein